MHLAEEGVAQVFKARQGSEWVVGVVGSLQFDVLAHRIQNEYDVPVVFEGTRVHAARWLESDDPLELKRFREQNAIWMAEDHNGSPVYLAPDAWRLKVATEDWPKIRFLVLKEQAP